VAFAVVEYSLASRIVRARIEPPRRRRMAFATLAQARRVVQDVLGFGGRGRRAA
jgi:hypothetical protein